MSIITWTDATGRYPELDKLPNAVDSATRHGYISMSEAMIESRLGGVYSVPFSSSNATAKSLCVDMMYVQTQMSRQPEKAEAVMKMLDAHIKGLLDGSSVMVDISGTIVASSGGGTVWSNTKDYHPTFGMSGVYDAVIDSAQIIAEEDARL